IGIQRAYNYALAPMSRARFIETVTSDLPDAPAYFTYDAMLNAREHPTLEQALERELHPLTLGQVLEDVAGGAQLLDTREPAKFEGAHLKGAVNVGLSGSYATWCGTLLDPQRPIVLIAEPGRETEAATRLGRIARITAGSLVERLRAPDPPMLIDVRAPGEWAERRIDVAVNLPLSRFPEQLATLDRDRSIVVHCASGYRSAIAASLLQREGFIEVADLVGGMAAWESAARAGGAPPVSS